MSLVLGSQWIHLANCIYHRSSLMGVIHLGRVDCILAQTIGAGLGDVILKVSCMLDHRVE